MDRQRVRERENQCIQEQPPTCTAACPIHVDARGIIECVRKQDFSAAFAIFNRFVPFPRIISRICDHPCEAECKRQEIGDPIRINALERACVDYSTKRAASATFSTRKSERIAVVGGGLSGLTAAYDLITKGYKVVLFEAGGQLGGRVRDLGEENLPQLSIDEDLKVIEDLPVEVRLHTRVGGYAQTGPSLAAVIEEFDAVYLGVGLASAASFAQELALQEDERITIEPLTFATSNPKVFAGGSHRYGGDSPITSVHDGRYAVLSIERFLQKASLTANRDQQGAFKTRLFTSIKGIESAVMVPMAEPQQGYSREEAIGEAERCLHCECLECVKVCEYLAFYKAYPKRYIRELYNNYCIILGMHPSNRMMNSCALCGLCEAVCPEKLSMGEFCLETRQAMVAKGKMPPSVHAFALRDMEFSASEQFALARHQPGHDTSRYVFFPGCQLSASSPGQVFAVYEHLQKSLEGGVGLILGCCGAPADWAGQKELFNGTLAAIQKQWTDLGSPHVITACSSCYRMFKDHAAAMPVESLWTVLDRVGLPPSVAPANSTVVAIHDPCTTRNDTDIQDSVRHLLGKLGVQVSELKDNRSLTTCCGYGGLMSLANPEIADKVVNRRIQESEADYLTYCAMCRDNFAAKGKRTFHLLDLILGTSNGDPAKRGPGYSQRHENRAKLKSRLLQDLWGENVAIEEDPIKLLISPEVVQLMEQRMILAEDVQKVIAHAESTGEKIEDTVTGRYLASYRPVAVTYWVEYSAIDMGFEVHNVYSHRMEVS
jgi:NADPH-dependent glutamate synthase beta subunit-like oxidoreductase